MNFDYLDFCRQKLPEGFQINGVYLNHLKHQLEQINRFSHKDAYLKDDDGGILELFTPCSYEYYKEGKLFLEKAGLFVFEWYYKSSPEDGFVFGQHNQNKWASIFVEENNIKPKIYDFFIIKVFNKIGYDIYSQTLYEDGQWDNFQYPF